MSECQYEEILDTGQFSWGSGYYRLFICVYACMRA